MLRPNTERPVTVCEGTNQLCKIENLSERVGEILNGYKKDRPSIALWDGNTSTRIRTSIRDIFETMEGA